MQVEQQCYRCGEMMNVEVKPDRSNPDLHSPDKLIPLMCGCTSADEALYETVDFGDWLDSEGTVVSMKFGDERVPVSQEVTFP